MDPQPVVDLLFNVLNYTKSSVSNKYSYSHHIRRVDHGALALPMYGFFYEELGTCVFFPLLILRAARSKCCSPKITVF